MTVGELLAKMSSRELSEWRAYFILLNEERKEDEMVQSAISGAAERRWSR